MKLADWVAELTKHKKLHECPTDEWLPFRSNDGSFLQLEGVTAGGFYRLRYYRTKNLSSFYQNGQVNEVGLYTWFTMSDPRSIKELNDEYI